MRPIKFRAWDGKRFWNWGYLEKSTFTGPPHPDYISQQFTGMCDKNGKEIYEGDILIHIPHLYSGHKKDLMRHDVKYNQFGFLPFYIWNERHSVDEDELEIIGNIYEKTISFSPL